MKRLALITLHGMGETKRDYAESLFAAVRRRLGDALYADVAPLPVYYQHILQGNEAEVWQRTLQMGKVHYDDLRKFLLFGIADAAGMDNQKERPASVYELAQIEIAKAMFAARAAVGDDGQVIAIAQSLGGQVLSSYLYDAQKAAKAAKNAARPPSAGVWRNIHAFARPISGGATLTNQDVAFIGGGALRLLYTTGCNIPIFVASHKTMDVIPIDPPTADFEWHNFYDPDDVLGWPLQPLNSGYGTLVQDHVMNAGQGLVNRLVKSWNPLSHTAYWTDDDVVVPLANHMRALLG
jgi:hypothetical protein